LFKFWKDFLESGPLPSPTAFCMKYILIGLCAVYPFLSDAQSPPMATSTVSQATNALERASYPKEYFRNPLDIPIKLAANFGELRANHYHMGLDIRTQQKENLPVMAAADGYVSRVVIEPLGFGQAIYIRHPNGYTTLYAHLNKFYPALADYVDAEQYRLQSWQVSLDIPAGRFPVKKGMFIALSGNRGGSQGPHLHFEIRRSSDDTNLNPLLFGMPVADDVPPVILRLAIYDRSLSTYEQSPRILPARMSSPGVCRLDDSLVTAGATHISFSISAFDSQSGSANPNGIYQAALYEDDTPVSRFVMDNISYLDTRKINAHIDYKTRESGGPWLQHLSRLPGYTAPTIYQEAAPRAAVPATGLNQLPADGVLDLSDGLPHRIRVEVKDAYGNTTALRFLVQYRPTPSPGIQAVPLPGKSFSPGSLDGYEGENVAFYVGENSLYDNVHIGCVITDSAVVGVSPVYSIGSTVIPLHDPLLVRIKPRTPRPPGGRSRVVMVRTAGGKKDVLAPEWMGDWASGRFREFGDFQLVEDRVAPVITPVGFHDGAVLTKAKRIAFRVKDDLGVIRRFRAELDPGTTGDNGQWLCFSNDKYLNFIYDLDKHCPPGKHVLKVTAEDVAGNSTIKEYRFVNGPAVHSGKVKHKTR
jgi:murein DD-endopeptidase MepM/ murein hydrolase activator NlpD